MSWDSILAIAALRTYPNGKVLCSGDKAMLYAMASHSNRDDGSLYAKVQTLADEGGFSSKRGAQIAINRLRAGGLIRIGRTSGGDRSCNWYYLDSALLAPPLTPATNAPVRIPPSLDEVMPLKTDDPIASLPPHSVQGTDDPIAGPSEKDFKNAEGSGDQALRLLLLFREHSRDRAGQARVNLGPNCSDVESPTSRILAMWRKAVKRCKCTEPELISLAERIASSQEFGYMDSVGIDFLCKPLTGHNTDHLGNAMARLRARERPAPGLAPKRVKRSPRVLPPKQAPKTAPAAVQTPQALDRPGTADRQTSFESLIGLPPETGKQSL